MKTCFAYPNQKLSFSETFIEIHRDKLDWDFFLCHSNFPCLNQAGKPLLNFPFNNLYLRGILRRISLKTYQHYYTQALAHCLKRNQIDLVFAEYGPTGANMLEACQLTNTQLVVHFHGYDASHYQTIEKYQKAYQKMFQYAHKVVVVSKDMGKRLAHLGLPEDKIFYNPYGIDIDKFSGAKPASSLPLFVAVGRFTAKKAPQLTIKAFAKVLKVCPTARLQMIGQGELWQECVDLAKQLKIDNFINFAGVFKAEQIIEVLKNARAFVQHSVIANNGDSEGTPNAILEASAMGLPIISTFHEGIKEAVINKETGFLVQEYAIDDMAEKMIFLAQNPDIAEKMGQNAQKYIKENYDMKQSLQKLRTIILND